MGSPSGEGVGIVGSGIGCSARVSVVGTEWSLNPYRADRNLTKVLQKYAMFGRFVHPLRPLIKGFPSISSLIFPKD